MDIIVSSTLDARVVELNPVPASEMDGVDDKRPSMLFIPVGLEALLQYTARRGFPTLTGPLMEKLATYLDLKLAPKGRPRAEGGMGKSKLHSLCLVDFVFGRDSMRVYSS